MKYNWDYLDPKAYNNKVGKYKYTKELNFILKSIRSENENLLDIAGGSGRFAIPLSGYCNAVTVVERNSSAITLLKSRNRDINAIQGDIMDVKLENLYSVVICIEALDYFDNWTKFFRKVNEFMTENGTFIFTYSNPDSWRYYLRKLKHIRKKGSHYNKMNFRKLKATLEECDFKIIAMEGMNWIPLPLASNSILVDFFINLERIFKLNRWYRQSPWLLLSVKKEYDK